MPEYKAQEVWMMVDDGRQEKEYKIKQKQEQEVYMNQELEQSSNVTCEIMNSRRKKPSRSM